MDESELRNGQNEEIAENLRLELRPLILEPAPKLGIAAPVAKFIQNANFKMNRCMDYGIVKNRILKHCLFMFWGFWQKICERKVIGRKS